MELVAAFVRLFAALIEAVVVWIVQTIAWLAALVVSLELWLQSRPDITSSLYWEAPDVPGGEASLRAYASWTPEMKARLNQIFHAMLWNTHAGLSASPPVTVTPDGGSPYHATRLQPALAWEYYVSYVAHALLLERLRRLPWSVGTYTSQQRAALFDSRWLFNYIPEDRAYAIMLDRLGVATPGDPVRRSCVCSIGAARI